MELANKRDIYDFTTTLSGISFTGQVEVINNTWKEVHCKLGNNQNNNLDIYKDDAGSYIVNINTLTLAEIISISDSVSSLLQEIEDSLEA